MLIIQFVLTMSTNFIALHDIIVLMLISYLLQLTSSAKIDRWFSLLPANVPALSRPESGFISGMEDGNDAATLAEARNLLLQLNAKKKRRFLPIRFTRRKILANKHTLL